VSAPGARELRQASLRRLRHFEVRPKRELGQNFLIDDNVLEVIGLAAELGPGDVVLEIGGGLGVLSEYLAARAAHVHVIEVDRSLLPALEDALSPFGNASLHLADVLDLDLRALAPAPGKVVANLPYGVAATAILKSIEELATARLWVAMVQREVADRLVASPGSKTYGITSVLAQLTCDVRFLRGIARTVFHPVPNVDSALVELRRARPAPGAHVHALVHAAFAHRRKTLPGSLGLVAEAHGEPGAALKQAAAAALEELGHRPDTRAERLGPGDFVLLAGELGESTLAPLRRR
jgi:16S rRNA (adenine1518-N6/adenine1519-N6)-dimethyltransferase